MITNTYISVPWRNARQYCILLAVCEEKWSRLSSVSFWSFWFSPLNRWLYEVRSIFSVWHFSRLQDALSQFVYPNAFSCISFCDF
jgi:hypothetical protein